MQQSQDVKWSAVISLVFLDLAILISWLAYNEYQPSLLTKFHFEELSLPLMILQGFILFITPPLAGLAADRLARRGRTMLPVVTVGINFVSMVFMVVAVTIAVESPAPWLRLLFPLMVGLWLIAMNIFHSPAISSLETFVPAEKLPLVFAIFAILADLIAATEPVLVNLIEEFGAPITFAVGGALVFLTGFWFQRASKHLVGSNQGLNAESASRKSNFPLVFLLGLVVGGLTTVFFKLFPNWVDANAGLSTMLNMSGASFCSILIAGAALLSLPAGYLASKVGQNRMALISASIACLLILGILVLDGPAALALYLIFAPAFAACSVTFLPIAFGKIAKDQFVLGVGIFFSGVELLASTVDVIQVMQAT